jgi:hypothetical protein
MAKTAQSGAQQYLVRLEEAVKHRGGKMMSPSSRGWETQDAHAERG